MTLGANIAVIARSVSDEAIQKTEQQRWIAALPLVARNDDGQLPLFSSPFAGRAGVGGRTTHTVRPHIEPV